jgi:hypothetical protein
MPAAGGAPLLGCCSKGWEWVRADVALQLLMYLVWLMDLVWLVETSDVDGRSYLAWAWFRGRLRSARLDLDQAATRH